jgi:hypothetical protein
MALTHAEAFLPALLNELGHENICAELRHSLMFVGCVTLNKRFSSAMCEGLLQGCNWGSLYFDLTYTEHVLKPLIEKLAGSGAMPVCIHDDSMTVADPKGACHMMDQLQQLGTST